MINKKDINSMSDGQIFETVALVKSYSSKPTKNGGKYMDGILEMKGSVPFKIWSGETYDNFDKYDYQDVICKVSGKVNEFGGIKSVILNNVQALDEGVYQKDDFFEEKYDSDAYWNALSTIIKKNCSGEVYDIFQSVIGDVKRRFLVEFAARGHHDAVKSGLLAHTLKVTSIMLKVVNLYPGIIKRCSLDLLLLGCALHDVGKVYEYTNGAILGNGLLVGHPTLGVEVVLAHKSEIVSGKGEEFFYRLLAIIQQHHGEFGEPPRALEAYLVYLIDNLESKFEAIDENIALGMEVISLSTFKLN